MAIIAIPHVRIAGIAASVPKNEVSNFDCDLMDEKERRLFVKNAGIEKRRIAPPGMCASDLCEKAARVLIDELKWNKEQIDALIFVTQTPDYITPATAILLQEKMGFKKSCLAFDINLGCSGYVYGLAVLSAILSRMPSGKGILLVGDVSSACISPKDKSVVPLFSDAGSATALQYDADADTMFFNLQSDGKRYEAIIIPGGAYRNPITPASLEMTEIEKGIARKPIHLVLQGIDVFNFSVSEVPENISVLMQHLRLSNDSVDYLLLHQANKIINDTIAESLNFPEEKTPSTLRYYGNTSSASIPVTMVAALREKLQTKKLNLLLSGFGVGLSWGSAFVQTDHIVCPAMIEI
jgi:3-oxoacyl-[acyl-carrier-protein] synthase-3